MYKFARCSRGVRNTCMNMCASFEVSLDNMKTSMGPRGRTYETNKTCPALANESQEFERQKGVKHMTWVINKKKVHSETDSERPSRATLNFGGKNEGLGSRFGWPVLLTRHLNLCLTPCTVFVPRDG